MTCMFVLNRCLIKYPDEFENDYESSKSVHSLNAPRQSQGASGYSVSDNGEYKNVYISPVIVCLSLSYPFYLDKTL